MIQYTVAFNNNIVYDSNFTNLLVTQHTIKYLFKTSVYIFVKYILDIPKETKSYTHRVLFICFFFFLFEKFDDALNKFCQMARAKALVFSILKCGRLDNNKNNKQNQLEIKSTS